MEIKSPSATSTVFAPLFPTTFPVPSSATWAATALLVVAIRRDTVYLSAEVLFAYGEPDNSTNNFFAVKVLATMYIEPEAQEFPTPEQ